MSKRNNKLMAALQARIAADNARFERMSMPDKRVAIALDVLDQLKTGILTPEQGTYFRADMERKVDADADMQDALAVMGECTVCARGALFVGMVLRTDRYKVGQAGYEVFGDRPAIFAEREHMDSYMRGLWTGHQLTVIEEAFEGWQLTYPRADGEYGPEVEDAWSNLNNYSDSTKLRLIMENIVINKGEFLPEVTPKLRGAVAYMPGFKEAEAEARRLQWADPAK